MTLPRTMLLAVGGIMLQAVTGQPLAAPAQQDNSARLESLRNEIEQTRSYLDSARIKKGTLEKRLQQSEEHIARLSRSLRSLRQQLDRERRQLEELKQQQGEKKQQLARQRQLLGKQVRAHYMIGQQGYAKLLLNQQNPADIGRVMVYYDYLNRAREDMIHTLQDDIAELAAIEAAVIGKSRDLSHTLEKQRTTRQRLRTQRSERARVLATLNSDIDQRDRQLQQLREDENDLLALITRLRDSRRAPPDRAAALPSFSSQKGRLALPAEGRVTARFGKPRRLGKLKWQGIMVSAPQGKEVHAISHGRVVFSGWMRNFGQLLIIDHGDGYMSLYGHNQALYKETGEWADQGELIATVGDSGGQNLAGLYLEIRHNGTPLDPLPWFRKRR